MSECPNCGAKLDVAVIECPKCGALFGPGSAWKTDDSVGPSGPSAAKILAMISVLAVLVPLSALIVGIAIQSNIPGCHVDEGAGAHGCVILAVNIGWLLEWLILIGFAAFIFSLIFVLVPGLVLAEIIHTVTKSNRRKRTVHRPNSKAAR